MVLNPTKQYKETSLYDCKKNLSYLLLNEWKKNITSMTCKIYEQQLEFWSNGDFTNIEFVIPKKSNELLMCISNLIMTNEKKLVITIDRKNFDNELKDKFGSQLTYKNFYLKEKYIRYLNEEGIDYGGLKRDFLDMLSNSIKEKCEELNGYYLPNKFDKDIEKKNNYWYVIGKMILLCLLHNDKLSIQIAPFIFEYILKKNNIKDTELYKHYSMLNIKPFSFMEKSNESSNDIDQMIKESLIYRKQRVLDLIYDGFWNTLNANQILLEYIHSLSSMDLYDMITGKINISSNDINIHSNNIQCKKWLKNILDSFSDEQVKQFLKFSTGSIQLPNKTLRLYTFKEYNNENLPIASTCEYLIKIPEYKTQEQFKRKLEQAIPCSLFNKY